MLDKLKAFTRHLIIAAIPVAATVVLTQVVPSLQAQYGGTMVGALIIEGLVLYLTPLTRQYGKFKN